MSVGRQPHQNVDWIDTMTMFLIQSAILLAIAFIIGCIIGCLLRRMFASDEATMPVAAAAVTAAAVAAVAPRPASAPVAAEPRPEPEPAPAPVAAPVMAVMPKPVAKAVTKPVSKPAIKAVSKPKAAPAQAAVMAKPAKPDDLKLIVGIGPVNERKLHALDVKRFAQIAAWSSKDEESYGQKLEFPGRIEREEWVRQAKNLAAGGKSEDAGELARRKGQSKPASLIGSPVKSSASKAKSTAPKPIASVKKLMPMKLDKPVGGKPDNLTLIDGIGNVIEKKLNELGVFHFEQIANWTMSQAETFSKSIGFPGRALREGWVKEAAIFAKGGTTDHAKKVEAGKITTSRVSTAAEKGKKK
jgi:predicted flap endonuclease-1-like 5' DNA nuclease